MADIKFDDWDWDGALASYQKAFDLNPDSIDACGCYAIVLAALGRFDEATRIVERGISVNPLAAELRFNYGFVLYMNRKYADAERELLRAVDLEPRYVLAYILLSLNYAKMGRLQDALASIDRPELQASGTLGASYAALGRRDDALKILARVDLEVDPLSASHVYFALGDSNRGFEYLTKSVERRQGPVRWLNVWPFYDDVRSDPRFAALVARLKLPEPPTRR